MAKPSATQIKSLKNFNRIAGVFHLLQMLAVLALANDFALPMTGTYLNGPPGTTFSAPVVILETPVGLAVALFLGLSALFHFIVSSGNFFKRYSASLLKNQNIFRRLLLWIRFYVKYQKE